MLSTPRSSGFTLALTAIILISGCSSGGSTFDAPDKPQTAAPSAEDGVPTALKQPTRSGFLTDYTALKPNPNHPGGASLLQVGDGLPQYRSFIIEQPKVLATSTVRGKPIDAAAAALIAGDLRSAVQNSLSVNFTITDKPGPGVARLRSAVTQIAECLHEPDSPDRFIGGASVEMEIVDSQTGKRLAAASESDAVTSRDPLLQSTDPYYDARLVFQHWSARLSKWLTDAQP